MVIKGRDARRVGLRTEVLNLVDLEAEAEGIIARARAEARGLLEAARRQGRELAERARAEGYRAGRQQGLSEGRQEGQEQALAEARGVFAQQQERLVSSLAEAVEQLERQKRAILARAHSDLVGLAVAIAEKAIKRAGLLERSVVEENLREAIELVGGASDVVVRVHPEQLEAMRVFAERLLEQEGRLRHVRVVADEQVGPGGCVVSTAGGQVDARLETQVERIAEQLLPGKGA